MVLLAVGLAPVSAHGRADCQVGGGCVVIGSGEVGDCDGTVVTGNGVGGGRLYVVRACKLGMGSGQRQLQLAVADVVVRGSCPQRPDVWQRVVWAWDRAVPAPQLDLNMTGR